ncbi:MAG TPA: hypothetical protein VMW47_06675 [Verrucomicrobiae bacterium]|nr:hypothetical protein [Verrucomicrobiae bacterium]
MTVRLGLPGSRVTVERAGITLRTRHGEDADPAETGGHRPALGEGGVSPW